MGGQAPDLLSTAFEHMCFGPWWMLVSTRGSHVGASPATCVQGP